MDKERVGISLKEYMKWGNDFDKRYRLKANTLKKRIKLTILFFSKLLPLLIPRLLVICIATFVVTLIIMFYKLSPNLLYLFLILMNWYLLRKVVFTKKCINMMEAILDSL